MQTSYRASIMNCICSKKSISQRANALNNLKYSIGGKRMQNKSDEYHKYNIILFHLPASILEKKENIRRRTHSEQPSDEEY